MYDPTSGEDVASRGYINKGMKTSNTDEWETPQDLFDRLNRIFCFTLDACATNHNAKCSKYYTKEQDGLKMPWGGIECGAIHLTGKRL